MQSVLGYLFCFLGASWIGWVYSEYKTELYRHSWHEVAGSPMFWEAAWWGLIPIFVGTFLVWTV